jgi:hypothetical protein
MMAHEHDGCENRYDTVQRLANGQTWGQNVPEACRVDEGLSSSSSHEWDPRQDHQPSQGIFHWERVDSGLHSSFFHWEKSHALDAVIPAEQHTYELLDRNIEQSYYSDQTPDHLCNPLCARQVGITMASEDELAEQRRLAASYQPDVKVGFHDRPTHVPD